MQVHEWPHQRPAQAGAVGDGRVDVADAGYPLVNEVKGLAPQRGLQAVGDVTSDLAPYMNGALAQRRVEIHGTLDAVWRGGIATTHFHQRDQVRRIERMTQNHALRRLAAYLHAADRQTRAAAGQQYLRRRGRVHARIEVSLEVGALGAAFLHEVAAVQRTLKFGVEAQAFGRCSIRQPHALHGRPVALHRLVQALLGAGCGIGGRHIQAARQEECRPAGTDHAGADHGHAPYRGCGRAHDVFHCAQRVSARVVQAASPRMVSTTL